MNYSMNSASMLYAVNVSDCEYLQYCTLRDCIVLYILVNYAATFLEATYVALTSHFHFHLHSCTVPLLSFTGPIICYMLRAV
jgi:hypothetical protein